VPALRAAAPADPGEAAASPVLVATGQMAHLRLHSANSSIQLEVLALQPGHARETIRVRLPLTGRTLRAAVTGRETLDASF
jgi:flagella basal body P-ring formation protein FlgA